MAPRRLASSITLSAGTNKNSACLSTNLLMSHGQATRSTLTRSRVIHFMMCSYDLSSRATAVRAAVPCLTAHPASDIAQTGEVTVIDRGQRARPFVLRLPPRHGVAGRQPDIAQLMFVEPGERLLRAAPAAPLLERDIKPRQGLDDGNDEVAVGEGGVVF